MEWYWIYLLAVAAFCLGWAGCAIMSMAKEVGPPGITQDKGWPHKIWLAPRFTPEEAFAWFSGMDETEMSKILYPMVKNLYLGRRTIHRCPTRKTLNLLDNS